jgi:D-glycero-D-manno-heptose 1,7-bisphosphate phosphatase
MMAIEVGEVLDATADMMGSCRNKDSALAVFLDRDGTINEEVGYLSSAKDLRLIPGAVEAIRLLNQHGLKAVVVSNQSGVARGYLSEAQVREINRRLEEVLGEEGAYLDGIYFCPHHPEVGEPPYRVVCDCRKPKAGMLLKAAADLGLDLCCSYVIGDHVSDVVLGKTMGLKSILLLSGHGRKEMQRISSGEAMPPDAVCTDLREAVQWVLRDLKEA